jgi:hypothetical protein
MDYSLLIGVKKERFEVLGPDSGGLDVGGSSGSSGSSTDGGGYRSAHDSGRYHQQHHLQQKAVIGAPSGRITDFGGHRFTSFSTSPSTGTGGIAATATATATAGATTAGAATASESTGTRGVSAPSTPLKVRSRHDGDDDMDELDEDGEGGLRSHIVEGPAKYYIGIIDVLQEWNLMKQLERAAKVYLYRQDPDGLSAINTKDYAARFMKNCVYEVFEGVEDPHAVLRQGRSGAGAAGCGGTAGTVADTDDSSSSYMGGDGRLSSAAGINGSTTD